MRGRTSILPLPAEPLKAHRPFRLALAPIRKGRCKLYKVPAEKLFEVIFEEQTRILEKKLRKKLGFK